MAPINFNLSNFSSKQESIRKMSYKDFNKYRESMVDDGDESDEKEESTRKGFGFAKKDEDNMEVDQAPKERKWYKHVYKSSKKGHLRGHKSYSAGDRNDRKNDQKIPLDLRSRVIGRNLRDVKLQEEYMT